MENEIWKDIPNYEGAYQVSSFGRVKSLSRKLMMRGKHPYISKEKILKNCIDKRGYYHVRLHIYNKEQNYDVHVLVAIAFLNHSPCGLRMVINHKNFIKTDNRVENLEIVTARENTNKKHLKSSSVYTGVHWSKTKKKWIGQIHINGKQEYLGSFLNEIDAHLSYQKRFKEYKKNNI